MKARSPRHLLLFKLLYVSLFFAVMLCGQGAFAQSGVRGGVSFMDQTPRLTLGDSYQSHNVLENAVIYRDDEKSETLQSIKQRFLAGTKGDVQASDLLNLSYKDSAYWIVFEVNNRIANDKWVLDFGTVATGKAGMPRQYFFYNASQEKILFDSTGEGLGAAESVNKSGSTTPFELKSGRSNIFIIYLQPSDSMALAFPLHIRAAASGPNLSEVAFLSSAYFKLVLGGSIVFLMGVCVFKGGWIFLPLIIIMALRYGWFWLQDSFIMLPHTVIDFIPALYITITNLMALLASWLFCNSARREDDGALMLIIISSVVGFAFLMYAFILPEATILRTVTLYIPYLITFLTAAFYCFGQHAMGTHGARFLGVTWIIWLSGMIVHFLAAAEILPLNIWFLQAEWYVTGGVVLALMLAISGRFEGLRQEAVQAIIRKAQKAQSMAKLKQSKETADQARLLRVIEREREIMEELRQREALRTEEMRQAKIAADEANNAKSAFLAVVSHEIRTPMTGIMGMVRLMSDTPLTKEQTEFLQTIKDSGDAMLALLNDILDFSKIQGGGMELEIVDFDLQRTVEGVVRLMSGHAAQRNIYVRADIADDLPRFLKGDPTRLRQVLLNIVGNAIKFTSEGGVTIHVYRDADAQTVYERPHDIPIKFVVEDTGIGISEEGQKNLFTPFAQADSSIARKFGGTGLGLAICKRLIEAMGSTIELFSVEGQGTKFYFTLMMEQGSADFEEAEAIGSSSDAAVGAPQAKLMILVVDDNEVNRRVVQGIISKYGHKTAMAETARDAVALAEYNNFDLILMDIELPDMNGAEATTFIRGSQKIQKQPHIAALTGNVQQSDIDSYLESGMDSHLAKPIEPQKLEELLSYVVAQKLEKEGTEAPQTDAADITMPGDVSPAEENGVESAGHGDSAVSVDSAVGEGLQAPEGEARDDITAPQSRMAENEPLAAEIAADDETAAVVDPADMASNHGEEPMVDDAAMPEQKVLEAEGGEGEVTSSQAETEAETGVEAEAAADLAEYSDIFDEPMLAGLKDAMGKDQMDELLLPLFDKNDELVAAMQASYEAEEWEELQHRAHEMKGMNGNFGLRKMSEIGGAIEKLGREGVTDKDAYAPHMQILPETKDKSKKILEEWMVA